MSGTASWLERRAALTPDGLALATEDERLTWRELSGRVQAAAARLRALGVRDGDRVATWLPSGTPLVELFHAAPLCGAVLCPLNTRWTAHELTVSLSDCGARWLVTDAAGIATAEKARQEAPGPHCVDWSEARLRPAPSAASQPLRERIDLEEMLAVLHTSGTSGAPKGVPLTHANFWWAAVGSAMHLGAHAKDRWLLCVPLYHVAGLSILVRSVLFGAAVVLLPRFDAARVDRALDQEAITLVSWVPTQLQVVLEARASAPPAALRCVLLGGGPIPETLLDAAWRAGWPVAPTYGLTETTAQVATLPLPEIGRRRGARPLLPVDVRIVEPGGRPCPPETAGEIEVRGPTVMRGYLGRPDETARAFRDGWLRTGDVGHLDDEGFLHVLDRRTDLIVSGGENVAPAEVEAVLRAHPGVADAAVGPLRDERLGQRVAAWVVPRSGVELDVADLQRFCRERLAGYKIPRTLRVVPALPRSEAGKLLRRLLVEDVAGEGTPRPSDPQASGA